MQEIIVKHIKEHQETLNSLQNIIPLIENISLLIANALKAGKTIFWCGNGGSCSDSQHLAGELIGRFVGNRLPLKSIALLTGGAEGSCIANDFGYDQIFSRQIDGLGSNGDVLIGISTSGNSSNIINALKIANDKSMLTIGLLGKGGGEASKLAKQSIIVSSNITARIQEMHILIGHILCDLIEERLNLKE
ncbi:MAG: SIS domain-containing protein [Methylophilaceae bacterium]|nr:SIS domain-containing protein [Methylophilaceae bacterium]